MKTIFKVSVLAVLLAVAPRPCFALREIAVVTKREAKEMGIEVRARPAGPDALWLELEFKPEGKLKEFTQVELKMTEGQKSLVVSTALRETRSSSGNIMVTFTAGRAYVEKTTLSVVMHSPREAGDHTYELPMKDYVELEGVRSDEENYEYVAQILAMPSRRATVTEIAPCYAVFRTEAGRTFVIGSPAAPPEVVHFLVTLEKGKTYSFPQAFMEHQKAQRVPTPAPAGKRPSP
jgi:hypothetical protein